MAACAAPSLLVQPLQVRAARCRVRGPRPGALPLPNHCCIVCENIKPGMVAPSQTLCERSFAAHWAQHGSMSGVPGKSERRVAELLAVDLPLDLAILVSYSPSVDGPASSNLSSELSAPLLSGNFARRLLAQKSAWAVAPMRGADRLCNQKLRID